jgi:hypothetical protein
MRGHACPLQVPVGKIFVPENDSFILFFFTNPKRHDIMKKNK